MKSTKYYEAGAVPRVAAKNLIKKTKLNVRAKATLDCRKTIFFIMYHSYVYVYVISQIILCSKIKNNGRVTRGNPVLRCSIYMHRPIFGAACIEWPDLSFTTF